MQRKKKKLYCVLLTICFLASCICSDDIKTDYLMPLFGATNPSSQIIATNYRTPNKDVCTVDMLENARTSLLSQQSVNQNTQIQRKSKTLFYLSDDLRSLQTSLKFYTSANPNIYTNSVDVTGIIHFIHDKDGKKQI